MKQKKYATNAKMDVTVVQTILINVIHALKTIGYKWDQVYVICNVILAHIKVWILIFALLAKKVVKFVLIWHANYVLDNF